MAFFVSIIANNNYIGISIIYTNHQLAQTLSACVMCKCGATYVEIR